MADEVKPTLVPLGYGKLPTGVRCRCIKLWTDGVDHYCCKGAPPMTLPIARIDELLAALNPKALEAALNARPYMLATVRSIIEPNHKAADIISAAIVAYLKALPPVKKPAEIEHVGSEGVEPVAWASEDAMRKLKAGSPTAVDPHFSPKFGVTIPLYASPLPVEPVTVDEGMVTDTTALLETLRAYGGNNTLDYRHRAASAIERLEAERDAILEIAEDLRRKHPMRWKIDIIEAAEAQRDQLAEALRIAEAVLRHHPTPFSTTDGGAIPLTSASEAAERARTALASLEGKSQDVDDGQPDEAQEWRDYDPEC